tara:strand:+ start:5323 stop:6939 length:1617 start_codon:yes stop_codon:yes gene_type:complete
MAVMADNLTDNNSKANLDTETSTEEEVEIDIEAAADKPQGENVQDIDKLDSDSPNNLNQNEEAGIEDGDFSDMEESGESQENDNPSESQKKNNKNKLIIIISSALAATLIITAILIFLLSTDTTEGKAELTPGYVTSIKIPPKSRKRMKTGLELSRENQATKTSSFAKVDETSSNTNTAIKSGSEKPKDVNVTSEGKNATPGKVIGARMVPGQGLALPSVTAAAFQAVPDKEKSEAITAPDEELMESIEGKALPKLSARGKASYQVYNFKFTPTVEKVKASDGESIIEVPYPRVAIVIKGLGLNRNATLAAINKLPAAISLAFSPYAKSIEQWAGLARGAGHEVLLEMPMEAIEFPSSDPGPLALLSDLKTEENIARLNSILALSQAYVGVIQYMGSKFTISEGAITPILQTLKNRGLFYLDDNSVVNSLATKISANISLPHGLIDMLVDNNASGIQIRENLKKLEKIAQNKQSTLGLAKKNLSALGLGEPYPATITQIASWAKTLKNKKIDLAPITSVLRDDFKNNVDIKNEKKPNQ